MSGNNVVDIYEWQRPVKPGEFIKVCALAELPTPAQTEISERPRKTRLGELALVLTLFALVSLLVASYI